MGFSDEYYYDDYSSYGAPEQETSYWNQPEVDDETAYWSQQEQYQPAPQTFEAPYEADAYYQVPPSPGGQPEQPWYSAAAEGLGKYAKENPKDVLGMLAGGGMGLWGLLKGDQEAPAPDLRGVNQANALLQNQLQSTQGLNADAVAKLRAQIGGDYGDYADAAGARSGATAKLQQLMTNGPDYTLQPEEERAVAELAQKWQSKGMMGSSLHNSELQALKDGFRTNALQRYQSELKSLQDIANSFSNQTSTQFNNTGNVVNQGESRQITGLGQLAQTGLQGAQLKSNVDQNNSKLSQSRADQLLKVGGDIFGRSLSNPQKQIAAEQGAIDPRTGKPRTGLSG